MAKRTAHSVTQVLKSKLKKLLTALANPSQSQKHNSKTWTSSKNDLALWNPPKSAVDVVSCVRESRDDGMLEQPPAEILPIKSEAAPEDFRGKNASTDNIVTSQFEENSDVSEATTCAERGTVEQKQKQDQNISSTLLPNREQGRLNTTSETIEERPADGVSIILSSTKSSSAKEMSCGDDTSDKSDRSESQEGQIAIPIKSELAQQLQAAVLEHRKLKALEHDADLQLSSLEDQTDDLVIQSEGLQNAIADLKAGLERPEQCAEINTLYDAISTLREAEDDMQQRRQRLIRHMSTLYQDFRDEQCVLFETLDSMLVEKALIPPMVRSTPPDRNTLAESSSLSLSPKPTSDHPLRRSTTSANNHTKFVFDQAAAEAETRAALLHDFVSKRKNLDTCERRFDTRYDLFDNLEDLRKQDLKAGKDVGPPIAFDHFLYEETRLLTRNLIDAETKYEASKAAAVAAGIHLKYSDIESGFVDDVDDGYCLSMERDMVGDCDRGRIQDWLMKLEEKACPTRRLSVRDSAGLGDLVEVEDWLGDEVGMSDSASVVAEGPSRRRIDRWRSHIAQL